MAMTIDKQNGDVCFNEQAHAYFNLRDPKRKYISVTTLIHKFEQPYDRDFWSAYKAVEQLVDPDYWRLAKKELLATKTCTPKFLASYGIDTNDFNAVQQNILDGWQKENLASTQRGSTIHANLEHSFYAQKTDISLQKYGLGGKFECVEGRTELDLENGVYPEYLIYYDSPDNKIHLAGQIDLLVKEGTSFSIIDWKGLPLDTKIPTLTGWTTMGDIKVGDKIFDRSGKPTAVIHKSEIHNNPCYKITFDTGESIVADHEHRWLIALLPEYKRTGLVMTTKEIANYLQAHPDAQLIIRDSKPLELPTVQNVVVDVSTEETTLALVNSVLRASYSQRLEAASEVCAKYVTVNSEKKSFELKASSFSLAFAELLRTLGVKVAQTDSGDLLFQTDIIPSMNDKLPEIGLSYKYRIITSVVPTETVQTQCIEVDSDTSTFLCTEHFIVTHNTNKQIKKNSYFDAKTRTSEKLKYPLNDLDNCNYSTYNMQLSTYAWMVKQLHPEWKCNELVLVHFDHSNNMTTYHMDYLEKQVEKMLDFWKKESVLEEHRAQRKRIDY